MKRFVKRLLGFVLLLLISVGAFLSMWRSGADIDIRTDTATELNVFYDNGVYNGYHYDEAHVTDAYPLAPARQSIHVQIPAEKMSYLRLDFGTVPATIAVYRLEIHKSPYQVYQFNGAEILDTFHGINDISELWFEDGAAVYMVTGSDGFIAADADLLASGTPTVPMQSILALLLCVLGSLFICTLDISAKVFKRLFRKLLQLMASAKQIISQPKTPLEQWFGLGLCIVAAAGAALLMDGLVLKCIYKVVSLLGMDTLSRYFSAGQYFSLARAGFFFCLFLPVGLAIWLGRKKAVRYRYLLALLVLILMTLGQYTGSSLGFYDGMLYGNTDEYECSTLLGLPQGIRGDEWATEKPYYFAQVNGGDDLPYFNQKLMMDGADMVVSAFSPVKDPIILFRPSLIGFLFLPSANAFAFYWWWKLLALFMASFEICRLLSGRVRYGVLGALLFSFAPPIQWWLSQAAPVETLSFGFFAVVLYHSYLTAEKRLLRGFSLVGVFYCLTGFILTMYPASQVPFSYIFLSILIWLCYQHRNAKPFAPKRIGMYCVTAIPFAAMLARFMMMSGPAMAMQLNTIYPGKSRSWIPLSGEYPFYQLVNPFTALVRHPDFSNSCEISQFYSFGLVLIPLVCLLTWRYRKKMLLPALLCGVSTLLALVAWLPQVPWLNTITLLSMSYPVRILMACGIGYSLTLISLLPLLEETVRGIPRKKVVVLCMAGWIVLLCIATNSTNIFGYFRAFQFGPALLIGITGLLSYLAFLLLTGGKVNCRRFLVLLVALNMVSTLCVNPITRGTDSMFEKSTMAAIRQINAEAPGRWMVSGHSTISNLVTAQGVARVSGTYYYPDWTMMEIIDPERQFEHYWNQFAHIDMRLTTGETEVSIFDHEISQKVDGTSRIIYVNLDTAQSLGIKYVFTSVEIPEELLESGALVLRYQDATDPWAIYEVISSGDERGDTT